VNPVQLYVYRRVGTVSETEFANSWALLVVNIQNPEAVVLPADRTHQPALWCYPARDGLPARLFMVSTYCGAGETQCPAIYQISYNAASNSVSFASISLPTYSHALPHVVTTALIPATSDLVVSFATDFQNVAVVLSASVVPAVSAFPADGAGTNFAVLGSVLDPSANQQLLVSTISPTTGGNQFGYIAQVPSTQFVTLVPEPAASGPIMGTFFPPHLASLAVIYYSGSSIIARRFCLDQPCPPLSAPPLPVSAPRSPVAVPDAPVAAPTHLPPRFCPVLASGPGEANATLGVSFDQVTETFSFRLSYPLQRDETAGIVSPNHYLSAINFQFKNPCVGVSYLSTTGAFNASSGWTLLPVNRSNQVCDFVEIELSGVPFQRIIECLDFARATIAPEGGAVVVSPKNRASVLRQYGVFSGLSASGVNVVDNFNFQLRFPRILPLNVRPSVFRMYFEGQVSNIVPSMRLISSRVFLRDGMYNLEIRFNATVYYPYSLYPENFSISADYTAVTLTPWYGAVSSRCVKKVGFASWNGSLLPLAFLLFVFGSNFLVYDLR
jgi:hypothetical protein